MTTSWRDGRDKKQSSVPTSTSPQADIYPPGTKSPLDLSASNESALDYVSDARRKMGMLARMRFDNETKKELQQIAGAIAINYLAAQKEIMLSKISAGVGIAKREVFRELLSKAVEQDQDLLRRTNAAQKSMSDMIEQETLVVLEEKTRKFDDAKDKLDRGLLMQVDYEGLCNFYTQNAEKLINDKVVRMNNVSQSYLDHFGDAVKKYQEQALKKIGGIIS